VEALIATRAAQLRFLAFQGVSSVTAYTVCHVDESEADVPMSGKAGVGFALCA
jgi:hypothetical protein